MWLLKSITTAFYDACYYVSGFMYQWYIERICFMYQCIQEENMIQVSHLTWIDLWNYWIFWYQGTRLRIFKFWKADNSKLIPFSVMSVYSDDKLSRHIMCIVEPGHLLPLSLSLVLIQQGYSLKNHVNLKNSHKKSSNIIRDTRYKIYLIK